MKTITITAPVVEPITLATAKNQLRIEQVFTDDDDSISALISVARDRAEKYCNRFFTVQTVALVEVGSFPDVLAIPYPDVQTVDAITYTDANGSTQSLVGFSFNPDTQIIKPADSFPTAQDFKIQITTGAPVEFAGAVQAMLMCLTDLYETRAESVVGVSIAENPVVDILLNQYRENMGV